MRLLGCNAPTSLVNVFVQKKKYVGGKSLGNVGLVLEGGEEGEMFNLVKFKVRIYGITGKDEVPAYLAATARWWWCP